MKKLSILILFLLVILPVYAQEGNKVYLPVIFKQPTQEIEHEVWKVVSPVASSNYVMNPSAENTGNYSALGSATITRSTTYQKYGLYSFRVQTGSNGQGISLTLATLTNSAHFATFRVRGQMPVNTRMIIGTGLRTPQFIEHIDNDWDLYGAPFNSTEANARTELRIIQQGNGKSDFYVDGAQVEPLSYWTTYIDGDQPGCYWDGPAHNAKSIRSEKSKDGGQVIDLYEQYGFFVTRNLGAGMPPAQNNIDSYAILPGGELNSVKIQVRDFSLVGKFISGSEDELYANRKALHTLLRKDNRGQQLKWLIYHPNEIREIKALYNGGLEGDAPVYYEEEWVAEGDNQWAQVSQFVEPAAINLKATDPYFYRLGEKVAVLDTNDSATFRTVAGRLKSTGQWSALGPPDVAGTYNSVRAIAEDATYVYIGGSFTTWDNIADANYLVRYHKQTGAYSALGTGPNQNVFALALMADGNLAVGGSFTSAGGVANTARIAIWNTTSGAWQALGLGMSNNSVLALVVGLDGTLYAGGSFTAPQTRIAAWNGVGWSGLGVGANSSVSGLAIHPQTGDLYAGGLFTSIGGVTAQKKAKWDGSTWTALDNNVGADAGDFVNGLAFSSDSILYAAGRLTFADASINYIASWNGTSWSALGSGLNDSANKVSIGQDGVVYVSGAFTSAGGITLGDRIAKWNGYAWAHLDIDLPLSPTVYLIFASKYVDPIISQKYDLYLGFDTSGTGYFAGKVTATNNGSSDAYPKIIFERSGGTVVTVQTLRNENTGKELLFNYSLLNGERLTIDLTPTKKSVISSYFGDRQDAVLANSDLGDWLLEPGDNDITSFVDNDNIVLYPSEVTAWMVWRETFESFD